jgi:hypothetical protein
LTLADLARQGATRIEERKRRRTRDDCRAFLQEVSAVTSKIAAHAFHPSLRRPGRAAGKSLSRRPTAVDTSPEQGSKNLPSPSLSGDLLREARLRAGLTQAEPAERAGTARSQVSRYERGDVLPSLETLRRLIRECGLELSFRLFDADLDEHDATLIAQLLPLTPEQRVDRAVRAVKHVYAS